MTKSEKKKGCYGSEEKKLTEEPSSGVGVIGLRLLLVATPPESRICLSYAHIALLQIALLQSRMHQSH